MRGPVARMLEGGRLHLQQGPIDLIIGAEGPGRATAFEAARVRFGTILQELVDELPGLRAPVGSVPVSGTVALRMVKSVNAVAGEDFVTPMAAVAGAVADEVLDAMREAGELVRAYVNNGGDIALLLGPGARYDLALAGLEGQRLGTVNLHCDHKIGGVATSGRGGRSLTLGLADSVTVLAESSAIADAAATLIANAVDLPGNAGISRRHASELDHDSDLGDRLVVTLVPPLSPAERRQALAAGCARAEAMLANDQIRGAALFLQGDASVVGLPMFTQLSEETLLHA